MLASSRFVVVQKFNVVANSAKIIFDALTDIKRNVALFKPVTNSSAIGSAVSGAVFLISFDKIHT